MPVPSGKPTVIGAGFGGMAVSAVLSRERVPHLLIGDPPKPGVPRLGESLNLEGTLGMADVFPDFRKHCFNKRHIVGYFGENVFSCDMRTNPNLLSRTIFKLLGHTRPVELVHVDRTALDPELYETVVTSPFCTALDLRVNHVAYDADSDAVSGITLSDGADIQPSYVFDATNHLGLIAKAAGVQRRPLGQSQRVVYTQYHAGDVLPTEHQPWLTTTNILRLSQETDSIDAMAWCIPLEKYVSVGISTRVTPDMPSDHELMELVRTAYERRGLWYSGSFPNSPELGGITHRPFMSNRAFGANWLLAGPTYCQVWWTASAGVGSCFSAAYVAPSVLRRPIESGRAYQTYMEDLTRTHDVFDWFASADESAMTAEGLKNQANRFFNMSVGRLFESTSIRKGRLAQAAGFLLLGAHDKGLISTGGSCEVHGVKRQTQTEVLFAAIE